MDYNVVETVGFVLLALWLLGVAGTLLAIAWFMWVIGKCLFTIVELLPNRTLENGPPDQKMAPWFMRTTPTINEVVARMRRAQVNAKAAQEAEYARDEELAATGPRARARIRSVLGGPLASTP